MFSEEVEFYFREKFIDNKYLALYKKIVLKFLHNPVPRRKGHRHHIIPKSIVPGIADDKTNIVCLGYREHFICHRLLPKFCKNKSDRIKMEISITRLLNSKNYGGIRISGRTFAVITELSREAKRELAKEPSFRKRMCAAQSKAQGKEETKKKRSLALRRFFENETPEEKELRKSKVRGKICSEETRRLISDASKRTWDRLRETGYKRPKVSEESRKKMSESQTKRYEKIGKRPKNFVIIVKSDKLRRERASRQSSGGNNPRAIPVIAYDDNGWEMHFSHYKAGAAFADTCRQSIRKVIDGDMKTAGKNPITKRKLKWRKK